MVVGEIMRLVSGSMSKENKVNGITKTVNDKLGKDPGIRKGKSKGLPAWYRPGYKPG